MGLLQLETGEPVNDTKRIQILIPHQDKSRAGIINRTKRFQRIRFHVRANEYRICWITKKNCGYFFVVCVAVCLNIGVMVCRNECRINNYLPVCEHISVQGLRISVLVLCISVQIVMLSVTVVPGCQ